MQKGLRGRKHKQKNATRTLDFPETLNPFEVSEHRELESEGEEQTRGSR